MKRIGFLAAICAISTAAAWGQTALPYKITQVKVFGRGAQIHAETEANLVAGTQELLLDDVRYLQENTLQVKITPEVGYSVVEVEHPKSLKELTGYKALQARKDSLVAAGQAIQGRLEAAAQQIAFLNANYGVHSANVPPTVESVKNFSKYLEPELIKIYSARNQCMADQQANKTAQAEVEKQMDEFLRESATSARIVVRVESQRAQKVKLTASYFTEAASWNPIYFFKFNQTSGDAQLEYRANIGQWGGADWSGVQAALSLNQPSANLYIPEQYPHYLTYIDPSTAVEELSGIVRNEEQDKGVIMLRGTSNKAMAAEFPEVLFHQVKATDVEVSYQLLQPLNLASSKKASQTIPIKTETIPVSYHYETVPEQNTDILLTARVPGWQKLNLTDGRMNVLFNGQMLAQSNLSLENQTSDTLNIPLSKEVGMVVKRDRKEFEAKASGSKLEQTVSITITVKNNKAFAANLTVRDRYPLSQNSQVEVTLGDTSGATVDAENGFLRWELNLKPGEERKITFSYAVKYPKAGMIIL